MNCSSLNQLKVSNEKNRNIIIEQLKEQLQFLRMNSRNYESLRQRMKKLELDLELIDAQKVASQVEVGRKLQILNSNLGDLKAEKNILMNLKKQRELQRRDIEAQLQECRVNLLQRDDQLQKMRYLTVGLQSENRQFQQQHNSLKSKQNFIVAERARILERLRDREAIYQTLLQNIRVATLQSQNSVFRLHQQNFHHGHLQDRLAQLQALLKQSEIQKLQEDQQLSRLSQTIKQLRRQVSEGSSEVDSLKQKSSLFKRQGLAQEEIRGSLQLQNAALAQKIKYNKEIQLLNKEINISAVQNDQLLIKNTQLQHSCVGVSLYSQNLRNHNCALAQSLRDQLQEDNLVAKIINQRDSLNERLQGLVQFCGSMF